MCWGFVVAYRGLPLARVPGRILAAFAPLVLLISLADTAWSQGDVSAPPINSTDGALKAEAVGPDAPVFPVDFYDGLRAFDAGQFEVAIALWLEASRLGDTRSMIRIADEYADGTHLPKVPLAAAYYYSIAAKLGATVAAQKADAAVADLSPGQKHDLEQSVADYKPLSAAVAPSAAGASPKQLTPADWLAAAQYGDTALALRAVASRVPSDTTDASGWTPLMYASLSGSADVVDALISAGADVNKPSSDGYLPIHAAAFGGSQAVAKKLVDAGAHAAVTTDSGISAADIAREAKNAPLVAYLAGAEKADINALQTQLNELGYDVGKPDGTLNDRTRDQLAIFANRLALDPVRFPTADLTDGILDAAGTDVWGYATQYQKDGDQWLVNNWGVDALDAGDAKDVAMQRCTEQGGKSCKVLFVAPEGTCVGFAKGRSVWSRFYASAAEAEADTSAKCKRQGMKCDIDSYCVGQ